MKNKKKILILYSNTGAGHLRAAEAIAKHLSRNHQVKIIDGLLKNSLNFKINPSRSFYLLTGKYLFFYNFLYRSFNTPAGIIVFRYLLKNFYGKNISEIIQTEDPDIIISTHHFIAPSTIKNFQKKTPFYCVVSDLGQPHRIWFDSRANKLFLPDENMRDWVNKSFSIPKSKLLSLGFPLSQKIISPKKNKITNTLLLLGGGAGTGGIENITKYLLKNFPQKKMIVITGKNIVAKKNLEKIKNPNLEIHGFSNKIISLMKKSDIVITKAGPATTLEAISLKKPLILIKAVGIQEEENIKFVLNTKTGLYAPKFKDVKKSIEEIYSDYKKFTPKKINISINGGKKIAEYIQREIRRL